MNQSIHHSRRTILSGLLLGTGAVLGTGLTACSATSPPTSSPAPTSSTPAGTTRPGPSQESAPAAGSRTLLAYFSRPGENYYYGDRRTLDVGNTEVLARMIDEMIDCDLHKIEAADPYSASYDATVDRNVREQNSDARPGIANRLASIADYDTILIGSPVWNVRPPMIMTTFVEGLDFAGRTVLPFVTYAVSGLGRTQGIYAAACRGAQLKPGLAVQGEDVPDHRAEVETWLREAGLRR